jgi:hypothetical protein
MILEMYYRTNFNKVNWKILKPNRRSGKSNQIINKCVHVTNNIAYLFSESLLFIIKSIKRRINGRGKIPIHITRWKFYRGNSYLKSQYTLPDGSSIEVIILKIPIHIT